MTQFTKVWIARAATAFGLLIPALWVVALWDYWHGGESPGAGAMYVLILIPTLAMATLALGGSLRFHAVALRTQLGFRSSINWVIFGATASVFVVLVFYWLAVGYRVLAA